MGNEDVNTTLKGNDLIGYNLNEFPMHMLTQVQTATSEETIDYEATIHD